MPSQPDILEIDIPDDPPWMGRFDDSPVPDTAKAPVKLPSMLASDFAGKDVPARPWHVADMIPAGTVTLLFGDGATGKSLLSLQLAISTVLSSSWLGLPTRSGRVIYLSAEDDVDELHRRLADIMTAYDQADLDDLSELKLVPLAGEDAVLAAPTRKGGMIEPTPLWLAFEAATVEWQPALIICDTLADVFGGEENVRTQARQFIGLLRGLAIRTGAAVVVLAHPSLSGLSSGSGTSGSTGWSNSVRSRLYFQRVKDDDGLEPDPDARLLSVMKANYARLGTELRLKWHQGVFVPMDGPAITTMNAMASEARAERIFLELVDAYLTEGRSVSATPGANYAPLIFSRDARASGVTKRGFITAMNFLFQTLQIVNAEYGPPSKLRKRIERARAE
jgi:RecA-family ATPase